MKEMRRILLVFLVLLAGGLVLTRLQTPSPGAVRAGIAPVTRLGIQAADSTRRAYRTLLEDRDLRGRLDTLRQENAVLRQRNEQLTRDLERYRDLRQIVVTQRATALGIAQVVSIDSSPLQARLTLNRGQRDGVRVRMPVTRPEGLVGQVTGVTERTADVLGLADPESAVGVTLAGSRGGRGLARGYPPDRLKARFSLGVPLKVGDQLVTNSEKGVYPVGIPVGRIEEVLPLGPNDVHQTVIVKPAVDLGVVEDVTILEGL